MNFKTQLSFSFTFSKTYISHILNPYFECLFFGGVFWVKRSCYPISLYFTWLTNDMPDMHIHLIAIGEYQVKQYLQNGKFPGD